MLSKFAYDRLPVTRQLTEDELDIFTALLKYGTPLYKLYTFLVTDGISTGRPVMYAFMESKKSADMRKMFGSFKGVIGEYYPVRTFVMNKLAAQVRVSGVVSGCNVMLCYFRIGKAIRKHTPATSAAAAPNGPTICFLPYGPLVVHCPKWAVNAQSGMIHFGCVTTNRLESANGCLKTWRQILESDGYVLNVACQMTTCACSLVLRHLGPRPPILPYDGVGTDKFVVQNPDASRWMTTVLENAHARSARRCGSRAYICFLFLGISRFQAVRTVLHRVFSQLPSQSINDGCRVTNYRKKTWDFVCSVTTSSSHWCATDRVSYHADCCDGAPCPLYASGPSKKRKGVLAIRPAKRASYDVDLDRSAESQHSVSRNSVCVRVFGSKEELLDSLQNVNGRMNAPHEEAEHMYSSKRPTQLFALPIVGLFSGRTWSHTLSYLKMLSHQLPVLTVILPSGDRHPHPQCTAIASSTVSTQSYSLASSLTAFQDPEPFLTPTSSLLALPLVETAKVSINIVKLFSVPEMTDSMHLTRAMTTTVIDSTCSHHRSPGLLSRQVPLPPIFGLKRLLSKPCYGTPLNRPLYKLFSVLYKTTRLRPIIT
ncbi:hypothetical protein CLF_103842 [Clonorchis sinensis]|uniref:ZSWIM1/3 RNaseH-like domain-containing protein n=1 Tax=Clonorchis sinensis TaxID=79923 RepID=G7YNM8_CLOSI|nr:hypothetical protein CLF_103842 [Clonorchis sinensis]